MQCQQRFSLILDDRCKDLAVNNTAVELMCGEYDQIRQAKLPT
jgi:hypothetical protein